MDKLNQVNTMVKHEQSLAPAQPVSKLARSMWVRWVFIGLAWLCIALGILGIFIPGLPTVDFIILASVHDKFHRTLILSGFCFLKIAKISLNSSFFPKPIKR